MAKKKIGIIGTGAWATAIAQLAAHNGHNVMIFCHREDYLHYFNKDHENKAKLPGVNLPSNIVGTANKADFKDMDIVFLGCPSQHIRMIESFVPILDEKPIISLVKGMIMPKVLPENAEIIKQQCFISSYLHNLFPNSPVGVLSGPNLASEITQGLPATSVIASQDNSTVLSVQNVLSSEVFRVYTDSDYIGVELGGILKNIFAIAAGISDGLNLGYNAKAALITRSMQEMLRFGTYFGAEATTFFGLSGLGDLMTTCSEKSRNYRYGFKLGKEDVIEDNNITVEGVKTLPLIYEISQKSKLDMPIVTEVYNVVCKQKTAITALTDLMTRRLTSEK